LLLPPPLHRILHKAGSPIFEFTEQQAIINLASSLAALGKIFQVPRPGPTFPEITMTKLENIEPDPSISNGTCFYAPYKEASSNFIPCGNWVFGHVQCCEIGDKCLSHNACYSDYYGTTYLAGCSRFDFDDPSCPDKKSYKGMTMTTTTAVVAEYITNDMTTQTTHGPA
jgi:hypothetical protein